MVLSSYLWPIVLQQPQNEQLVLYYLLEDTSTTSKVLVERTHTATLLPHFTSDWVIFCMIHARLVKSTDNGHASQAALLGVSVDLYVSIVKHPV